jgi:hypothetical protein
MINVASLEQLKVGNASISQQLCTPAAGQNEQRAGSAPDLWAALNFKST